MTAAVTRIAARAPGCLACLLAGLLPLLVATAHAGEMFRWTDSAGHTHFGDQRPAEASTRVTATTHRAAERLTIEIEAQDADLSPQGRELVETGIRRVFDVYTGLFRLDIRRPVLVNIHVFHDLDALAGWVNSEEPGTTMPPGVLGLYMPKQNVIGAWHHSDDELAMIATLLHESSHVMLEQLSPKAPAWLHEGLAQYFEGMDPAADAIVIAPAADAAAAIDWYVANRQLVTLRQYFSLDDSQWRHLAHVEQNPIPYTVAWSVTYFLMSRPVGRQILIGLLQDLEKAQRAPTTQVIDQRYPGGYSVMEYDWFKWAQAPKTPQVLRW